MGEGGPKGRMRVLYNPHPPRFLMLRPIGLALRGGTLSQRERAITTNTSRILKRPENPHPTSVARDSPLLLVWTRLPREEGTALFPRHPRVHFPKYSLRARTWYRLFFARISMRCHFPSLRS